MARACAFSRRRPPRFPHAGLLHFGGVPRLGSLRHLHWSTVCIVGLLLGTVCIPLHTEGHEEFVPLPA